MNIDKLNEALSVYEEGLYAHLQKECPNLEKAKAWIHKWADEDKQKNPTIPGVTDVYLKACEIKDNGVYYSISKMAIMLSCVLEGRGVPGQEMMRPDTIYGWELYYAGRGAFVHGPDSARPTV